MSTPKPVCPDIEYHGVTFHVAEFTAPDFEGIEISERGEQQARRVLLPAEVAREVASAILRRDVLRNMHRRAW